MDSKQARKWKYKTIPETGPSRNESEAKYNISFKVSYKKSVSGISTDNCKVRWDRWKDGDEGIVQQEMRQKGGSVMCRSKEEKCEIRCNTMLTLY